MGVCPRCGKQLPSGEFPFCPWCSAPLTAPGVGARKTVSILFCDVVDSTSLGSSVDTEVLRGVLAGYWGRARSVVERHGGTVEKFIGDAVVGVFGVPVVHEDDALRAVRAASDLLVEVRDLNQDLQARLGVELAVRVGVNTGEVVSGAGGEALMSGDAANVAARLEAAAGAGEVLVGESTHRLVREVVDAVDVGPLVVKGKAEPLVAFRLLGVRPAVVGLGRRRFSGALVGRSRQLRLAEEMFATAVEESACVLLTVLGEPGVGKSRLVQELLARIGDETWVLQGRCLSYGEGITYWPTIEMLTGLAAAEATTTLAQHLSGVAHTEQILTGLDTMLGRAEAATGQEVAWAFRRLVETLAARRPVVLVVDDVQWAEPGLVDLLDHLTDMSRGAPILVVCMARPEFQATHPGWGSGRAHSTTMALRPLSEAECHQLTVQLLGAQVGAGLLDRVVAASEGVPLFVEELTAMLVDDGRLVPAVDGGWQLAAGLDQVLVPPSVQAMVAARLDGLAPDLREVIDVAAVIGKTFYPDALAVLVDDKVAHLVEALVRADLVQPSVTDLAGHDAYAFNHQLLRDAAYHGLTKARRAALHQGLARWLQQQPATAVSSEVIAYHLEAAATYRAELGNPDPALAEEAAQLLLTAADRSLALANTTTAVRLANRAASLAPAASKLRAEILLTLCTAAAEAGDYPTAVRCADDAEQIGAVLGDQAVQWRARLHKGRVDFWTDLSPQVDDLYSLTEQAIEAFTAVGNDRGLTLAYLLRSEVHIMFGRLRAAASDAEQGLRHAHRAGGVGGYQSRLLEWVMVPYDFGDGTPTEMAQALDEISAEFGNDPGIDGALANRRDMLPAYQGRLDDAHLRASSDYRLLLEKGSPILAALRLFDDVCWCQRWAGDLGGAAESLATAQQLLEDVGEVGYRSTVLADLAMILARLGRDDEAQTALTRSRAISNDDDLINDIYHAAAEGLLLAHRGESEASERQFLEGLRIAATTEYLSVHGELWLTRSYARESLGDPAGALTAAREALACFERKEQIPPIRTAQARITELGG